MPRPNRPWYRADRGEWYMTIGGVKTRLKVFDPDDLSGAMAAVERLQATAKPVQTVAGVVERFQREELPNRSEATISSYTQRLKWVVEKFGRVNITDLDPRAIRQAADRESGWRNGTKRLTLTVFQLVVRWGGRGDFSIEMPPWGQRDERCVISREELSAVLNLCKGDFGPLVQWLFLTGCRPKEGRTLTAEMVDWQGGKAILEDHKTRGKVQKAKTVYLSDSALDILKRQREKYRSGYLFRHTNGRPISASGIQARWRRIREALGLRSQVVTYGLRHSFATHLLEGGASARDVAELLGHTSTEMVTKIYSHFVDPGRLRDVAGKLG